MCFASAVSTTSDIWFFCSLKIAFDKFSKTSFSDTFENSLNNILLLFAGTLVYVLDGKSQSKSSGSWKTYSNNEYWFEKSDWVHGGEDDAPSLGDVCSDLVVIRVVESGKDHTVFID